MSHHGEDRDELGEHDRGAAAEKGVQYTRGLNSGNENANFIKNKEYNGNMTHQIIITTVQLNWTVMESD